MRFRRARAAALIAALPLLLQSPAAADGAPDRSFAIETGGSRTWAGAPATASNVNYWSEDDPSTAVIPSLTCTKDLTTYCETVLVELRNPLSEEEIALGIRERFRQAKVRLTGAEMPDDFDVVAYESDASGARGAELADSAHWPYDSIDEEMFVPVFTTVEQPSVHVLIHIVYYAVTRSGYTGSIDF